MTDQQVGFDQRMLECAERQAKTLEAIRLRADIVLLLMLIGVVLSLGGVFR
jgi:hypothetical protein